MFVYWMRFSPRAYSDIIFFEWSLMADFCLSRRAVVGQKQPVRCAYETRTDSEVALLAIQYYDRKASEVCTIVAGQELERFA